MWILPYHNHSDRVLGYGDSAKATDEQQLFPKMYHTSFLNSFDSWLGNSSVDCFIHKVA